MAKPKKSRTAGSFFGGMLNRTANKLADPMRNVNRGATTKKKKKTKKK